MTALKNSYEKQGECSLVLNHAKIIGPSMNAREIPQQKTEGGIATRALNRMTSLGMPVSVKVN